MTQIEDLKNAAEDGVERTADELEKEIHKALHPARRIPWLGIATGFAVIAGVVYLARHRSQRQKVEKAIAKGVQGGAVLALMVPGTVLKARQSAEHFAEESGRFLKRLGEKIPVKVVMK